MELKVILLLSLVATALATKPETDDLIAAEGQNLNSYAPAVPRYGGSGGAKVTSYNRRGSHAQTGDLLHKSSIHGGSYGAPHPAPVAYAPAGPVQGYAPAPHHQGPIARQGYAPGPAPHQGGFVAGPAPHQAEYATGPAPHQAGYAAGPAPHQRGYAAGPAPHQGSYAAGPAPHQGGYAAGPAPHQGGYASGPAPVHAAPRDYGPQRNAFSEHSQRISHDPHYDAAKDPVSQYAQYVPVYEYASKGPVTGNELSIYGYRK